MDSTFLNICKNCGNADQYFFPIEISSWSEEKTGNVYKIDNGFRTQPQIGGIRLHEWDRVNQNPSIEQQCQYDLSKALGAIQELRKIPNFHTLILSNDFVKAKQNENNKGQRIKLGLLISKDDKFADDIIAAKTCYKQIIKIINKSGFIIEDSKEFNAYDGMDGLCEWALSIKLKRKKNWLLLLLLPLFLLLFALPECTDNKLLNMQIETNSFIFIIDNSSSMEKIIDIARDEVDCLLKKLLNKQNIFSTYNVNIISYNGTANSALKKITKLNKNSAQKLNQYMNSLKADGGTVLKNAVMLAANEIKKHNSPTTLLIITDAEKDETIEEMLNDISNVKGWFGETDIYVNSVTPRALKFKDSDPVGSNEKNLARLSKLLNGNFSQLGEIR